MPMNRRVFGRQLRAGACLGHGGRSSHHCIAHVSSRKQKGSSLQGRTVSTSGRSEASKKEICRDPKG